MRDVLSEEEASSMREGIFISVCCSVDLQEQLRRENETYLRDHPELKKILAHYMARGRSILIHICLSYVWCRDLLANAYQVLLSSQSH